MAEREKLLLNINHIIAANGQYDLPLNTSEREKKTDLSVEWITPEITPAGAVTFVFGPDTGKAPLVMDFAANILTLPLNCSLPHIHFDVTGLPEGGKFILYIR